MPTYEYRCKSCAHEFEHFQSMKDAALRKCPACGKNMLERLIGTGAAVIFKGSGFYQTDYRNEAYKKAAEADKPKSESASSDASASDKSGTVKQSLDVGKAEAKPEPKIEKTPGESSNKPVTSSKNNASTPRAKSTKKPSK